MRLVPCMLAAACLLLAGCGDTSTDVAGPETAESAVSSAETAQTQVAEQPSEPAAAAGAKDKVATAGESVAIESGVVTLSPENTKIQFVGTHVGEKPDPRIGVFEKFSGKLEVDTASKTVKSIAVDIETESLLTQFPKLTGHLKSPDFFDVREHPKAAFHSTKIADAEEAGKVTVTGDFTLHGVTKSISFPAAVSVADDGLTLRSEFVIDRSEFGMTFSPDRVENDVAMTVVVGEKSQLPPAEPTTKGGGRRGTRKGRSGGARKAGGPEAKPSTSDESGAKQPERPDGE